MSPNKNFTIGEFTGAVTSNHNLEAWEWAFRSSQDALARSNVFRQLVEHIRDVFWVTDVSKTRMLYVSPAYEAIWGRSCESLYASPQDWLEAIHPEDRARVLEAALKQEEGKYDQTYRILRPDNSLRWIHDRAFPVRNEAGEIVRIAGIAEDITQRKQSETQLATLAQALESTSEPICITDLQDRFVFVNRAFLQTYGYSESEILDKSPDILFSPRNPPALMSEIMRQTRAGGWRGEVLDVRKDGTEFPIYLSTSRMLDQAGQVIGLVGVAQDITELRQAEAKYRSMFENATEGIFRTTPQGRYLSANPALARIFGYSSPEELMACVTDIERQTYVQPARRDEWKRVLEAEGSVQGFEAERFRKDGARIWVSINARAVRGPDGVTLYYEGTNQDITRRKQAEAARLELAAIVENSQDAIFSNTLDGKIVSWNQAAQRIYGYTAAEAVGQSVAMLLPVGCAGRLPDILKNVAAGQTLEGQDAMHRRKDGSPVAVSLTISPVRDLAGKVTGSSAIARDNTQRIQLEKEILESSMGERRRIGHELHDGLGQYLAGVAFRAKALEQSLAADGLSCVREARELTALISNAIRQTRSLARGLDPVEIEHHGLVAALESLACETERLFDIRCLFACRERDVHLEPETSLALYRIMQEAIHNAIKHGQARRIEAELVMMDGHLCLRIKDDGVGFETGAATLGGMGFRVMQYRSRSVGATLKIVSRINEGTEVQCVLPSRDGLPGSQSA